MAANRFSTYENHNAGEIHNYRRTLSPQIDSPLISNQYLSVLSTTTSTTIIVSSKLSLLVQSKQHESNTTIDKFLDIIPFTYFRWILVLIAIILIILFLTIFICYCRKFLTNYKTRSKSSSHFSQYRTKRRYIRPQSTNSPIAVKYDTFSTPPCPSKSLECLNQQLHRQDLNVTDSPQFARLNTYCRESLRTFTNSTSCLTITSSSRLSSRLFDPPLKVEQLYESQRVSMTVDDDANESFLTMNTN